MLLVKSYPPSSSGMLPCIACTGEPRHQGPPSLVQYLSNHPCISMLPRHRVSLLVCTSNHMMSLHPYCHMFRLQVRPPVRSSHLQPPSHMPHRWPLSNCMFPECSCSSISIS
ncbi:hypothetical protein MT325_m798L [Paramecium bursaria chlorella virus MT325]|uniref:Uncharacterized protein m798L n=1 Tax=Paramecium bursaria Chlorella virus MT325 TaxID=346932 RepID=A7IVH8_PBCVM|nr:hypothetical protein MT325_m798L [Paramecium bursaria chlorella virus MT325]